MREGFVFYRSWNDAIKLLPVEVQLEAFKAITDYALDGVEPAGSGIVYAIFLMAKPVIDKNEERAANGRKGGRPSKSASGSKKLNVDTEKPDVENMETAGYEKKNHWLSAEKPTETETVAVTETETDTIPPVAPPSRPSMDYIEKSNLSDPVKEKLEDFIRHRAEMGQPYTPTALQSLICEVQKQEQTHGSKNVIDVIEASIVSGYKGIVWDRIGHNAARKHLSTPLNNDEMLQAARRIDAGGTASIGWKGGLAI